MIWLKALAGIILDQMFVGEELIIFSLTVYICAFLGRQTHFKANRRPRHVHGSQEKKKKKIGECCILHQQKCAKRGSESGSLLFNPRFLLVILFRGVFSRHISALLAGLYLDPVMQTHICDSHCYITINQASLAYVAQTWGDECLQKHATVTGKKMKNKNTPKSQRIDEMPPRQSICTGNAARSLHRTIQIYI